MLVALRVFERPPRRFWRLGGRAHRVEGVRSGFVQVGSGRYLLITAVRDRKGRLDWAEIRRIAGPEAGHMLLPMGLTPPEGMDFGRFRGQALRRELMASTGLHLLRAAAIPPRHVTAGLYDPQARMPQLAAALLPYAADVRVVTARPEAYEIQEQLAMEAYGAALPVTREIESLNGATLILAPDGLEGVRLRARGLVLSGAAANRPGVVDGYIPQVPSDWLAKLPDGCDAWTYLAGLYERSGLREMAAKPPAALYAGSHTLSLRDAAWKLAGLDIGISV